MKKRHYILFIAGDVEPQIIGPFGSELKRDKTIRALRKKHGNQHGYFRLEQSPRGSLLAAAYANSWWQEALNKIIDYLWQDEQRHFNESTLEKQKEHIFQSLQTAKHWLDHRSPVLHRSKADADPVE